MTRSMSIGMTLAVVALASTASVQADPTSPAAAVPEANRAAGPSTAERHSMLAEGYERAAAAQRGEVEAIRQRGAAEYRQASGGAPNKTGVEYPWLAKKRKAYEGSVRIAQAQADEAQRHAEYHRFQAQDLQGR
jgi:hypothetical protein